MPKKTFDDYILDANEHLEQGDKDKAYYSAKKAFERSENAEQEKTAEILMEQIKPKDKDTDAPKEKEETYEVLVKKTLITKSRSFFNTGKKETVTEAEKELLEKFGVL